MLCIFCSSEASAYHFQFFQFMFWTLGNTYRGLPIVDSRVYKYAGTARLDWWFTVESSIPPLLKSQPLCWSSKNWRVLHQRLILANVYHVQLPSRVNKTTYYSLEAQRRCH